MLTTKRSASRNTGWLGAVSDWLHRISGGSSDTELKELAVSPCGRPSLSTVVITVTPVTNAPSTCRRARVSNPLSLAAMTSAPAWFRTSA
jgi:hypothetical protein